MRIDVTQEEINSGEDPIVLAAWRQHGLSCIVDSRYLIVIGNEKFPRRLPASAEQFQLDLAQGRPVKPFSFEI